VARREAAVAAQREATRAAVQRKAMQEAAQREAANGAHRPATREARFRAALLAQHEAARATKETLTNYHECRRAALALHKQHREAVAYAHFDEFGQMPPAYVYSTEEKRCVYKGGFVSTYSIVNEYLMDAAAKEVIAEYIMVNGNLTFGDPHGFEEAHRRYFLTTFD
jgi:hypothetical protein